jgi:hypothetical protein
MITHRLADDDILTIFTRSLADRRSPAPRR